MYSKKQISKAGIELADPNSDPTEKSAAMDTLSYWRGCHELPLEAAFDTLQSVAGKIDRDAIFAKRLKRTASIITKLQRNEGRMQLSRMQDIGGCRAIISTEKKLRKIVRELKKIPELRDPDGSFKIKDYIAAPKQDGYRSFHVVGRFSGDAELTQSIEIQVRTRIQHYWATAVEIVDLFTDQALKTNQGSPEWTDFFSAVSRQFAIMEGVHIFSQLPRQKQFGEYSNLLHEDESYLLDCLTVQRLMKSVDVSDLLEAFAGSLKIIDDRLSELTGSGYVLLKIDTANKFVSSGMYESNNSAAAEKAYIELEKEMIDDSNTVVALVSSAAVGGIKEAYPNYFADSSEFLQLLHIINSVKNTRSRGLFERLIGMNPPS